MKRMRMIQSRATANGAQALANAWDPLKIGPNESLTENNTVVTRIAAVSGWNSAHTLNPQPTDRKSVFELLPLVPGTGNMAGFTTKNPLTGYTTTYIGNAPDTGSIYWTMSNNGVLYSGTNVSKVAANLGKEAEFTKSDVAGFGYDPVTGKIVLFKNGLPLNNGEAVWTVSPGKILYPSVALYSFNAAAKILAGEGGLKYSYGQYSVPADGGIAGGQGTRFWDVSKKPSGVSLLDSGRQALVTTDLGTSYTGLATTNLPYGKKSVVEFVVSDTTKYAIAGLYFGSDLSGPKAGALGTLGFSLGVELSGSNNGKIYGVNCTRAITTFGAGFSVNGDVLALGYDPVARTVYAWKNGVALNSGNPVWTGVVAIDCWPAYTLSGLGGRVKLSTDLPRYNYGDFTN